MYQMERYCKNCKKDTEQNFYCDIHIVEPCPDDCDLVENSAEYSSTCTVCNEEMEEDVSCVRYEEVVGFRGV